MKMFVLGDRSMVTGFRLAGIDNFKASSSPDDLEKALENEDIGILIVSEKIVDNASWRLKKKLDTLAKPIVIPVPDKFGATGKTESIIEEVKKALGFDLSKK